MRHVDEGLLHAWLDGGLHAMSDAGELPDGITPADVEAHLRACADCRALLEQERAIRERAGLVLRDAALPTVAVPPFEMIAQQAPPARRRAWLPMAWAASVLMAVGAGWWGSELARSEGVRSERATLSIETAPAAPARGDEALGVAEAGQNAASEPMVETGAAAVTKPADEPVARVAAAGPRVEPDARDAARDDRADAVALDAPVVFAERAAPIVASAPPPVAPAPVAAAPAPIPAQTFVAPTTPQALREQAVTQQAGVPSRQPGAVPDEPAEGWAGYDPWVDNFRDNVRRARRDEFEWHALSRDELRRAGTSALTIAGAGVPVVDAAVGAVPSRLVRVRQTLESGVTVELMMTQRPAVQLEEAVVAGVTPRIEQQRRRVEEPGTAPRPLQSVHISSDELAGGEREVLVVVPRLGTYVVIRGSVSDDQLRALAQRLVEVQ
jgi:hypothetical protein